MTGRRSARELLSGVAALVALIVILVGVPFFLVRFVGNPWPGQQQIELVDRGAITLGAAAAVTWVVWARFVFAVLVELPGQWRDAMTDRRGAAGAPAFVAPPERNSAGIGMIAARLIASALVLLPIAPRVAAGSTSVPALTRSAPAVLVVDGSGASGGMHVSARPVDRSVTLDRADTMVAVADGDTLRGLARRHLGDAERWREIFELNRDRPQHGGARLSSPSALQAGWSLVVPADAHAQVPGSAGAPTPPPAPAPASMPAATPPAEPAPTAVPYITPTTVTIAAGDTLWDLSEQRLEAAGLPADDHHIVVQVDGVVAANPVVIGDPNLIFPGQQVELPAIGTPPPPIDLPAPVPPGAEPAPAPAAVEPAAPTPDPDAAPPTTVAETTTTSTTGPAATSTTSTTDVTTPTMASVSTDGPVTRSPETTPTSNTDASAVPAGPEAPGEIGVDRPSPSPIGLGEAALLSTGVLSLLAARRRRRLRAAEPRARIPEAPSEQVVTERQLRAVDARERLVRVDVAVRAAASSLLDSVAQPAIVRVGGDGAVELTLTADATLPTPWHPVDGRWVLPATVPIELLAEAARRVGAPCVALTQLGVDDDEREVLVDLEALGVLSVRGPDDVVDAVVRGVAATLASSIFAESANLVGVGLDELVFLDHRLSHHVESVDGAVELASTLVGTTASARQSTFVLRARHTSGESWEPAVVVVGTTMAHEVTEDMVRSVGRRHGGVAMVVGGDAPTGPWSLEAGADGWRLEPLGLRLTPVGLTIEELTAVYEVLHEADAPLVAGEPSLDAPTGEPRHTGTVDPSVDSVDDGHTQSESVEPPWQLLVRLLGEVDVVDGDGRPVRFERSKTLELVAWLTEHRTRSTRTSARSALWELDVRDATFANVVSEARRALARHVTPPDGEEWLERTLTERLPLHELVVSDADLVRARLEQARVEPPQQAIDTLRPAVELIRGVPFSGTGYLWPDPEGIASNLVLSATSAAGELAGHYLSMGDVDGVFWATGQGLAVLPGHEELIALRMRAHHRAGDLAGVRLEWESYERVLDADNFGDGEPAPKLVELRRDLLSPSRS